MKNIKYIATYLSLMILFGLLACNTPMQNDPSSVQPDLSLNNDNKPDFVGPYHRTTGDVFALWGECDDHEEGSGSSGNHDEDGNGEEAEEGHDEGCGAHPARDFHLQFNAREYPSIKGTVLLEGLNEYEGIRIEGSVTIYLAGTNSNEVFIGGKIEDGTVNKGCFMIGLQDNGEGNNVEPDHIHYRLYGKVNTPCHEPDHSPKEFPAKVYDGNLQVQ